jgi:hypothetical protein
MARPIKMTNILKALPFHMSISSTGNNLPDQFSIKTPNL